MNTKRTDLAVEARELFREAAKREDDLPGVSSEEYEKEGFRIHKVRIESEEGEREIGKPRGVYVTIDLAGLIRREDNAFLRAAKALGDEIRAMLPENRQGSVLVAGLGNRHITPDAVGPKTVEYVMVTRHLIERMPKEFAAFSETAAISPGVLGLTGVETAEILLGVAEKIRPCAIVAIDALASRRVARLCTTVQLSDSGIVPGAGVGNARGAITKDVFGVPVIALGVPTVVDAATLALDIAEEAGAARDIDMDKLMSSGGKLVVTPKDIDKAIADTAKVLGYGINFALHDNLSLEDMEMFLS